MIILKKFLCKLLGHNPKAMEPFRFADGSFGNIAVKCNRCDANETDMVNDGVNKNTIGIIKLDYANYLLHWDNMR